MVHWDRVATVDAEVVINFMAPVLSTSELYDATVKLSFIPKKTILDKKSKMCLLKSAVCVPYASQIVCMWKR